MREAAEALAGRALGLPEVAGARAVAAYVSGRPAGHPRAPGRAARAGGAFLLPALLPDNDLDWGEYTGAGSLARVRHGGRMELFEPAGERLGPDAVTRADVVLLPGVAVDGRGLRRARRRLVRPGAGASGGGGRASRAAGAAVRPRGRPHVPAQPHDRPVDAVVTPSGVRRFR
ncbi:5-formyltetrahydrofolate cyclo-ligase OS=Streptomyces tendae OX=1932 GN=GUR47_27390 PE=3 SV=1 [Streptomyces tendae]